MRFRMCSDSSSCFRNLRMKKPNVSKKQVKAYVALFVAMFSSSFAITMMFPFAPFLVKFLLPNVKETDVGNYVGILAAAMFFGRFLASYIWGLLADHKGRKPVIIASSILLGLTSAVFGFSSHFAMAILARFAVGATNGVVGTAKAVISEISDDSTQALGVSIISTSWGLGFVIGPAVSGAISDPIGQYHLNITNNAVRTFLTKFPYSLPCLLNTLLCLVAALVIFLLLEETKGMKKNRRRSEIDSSELKAVSASQKIEDQSDDYSGTSDCQREENCENVDKIVEIGHRNGEETQREGEGYQNGDETQREGECYQNGEETQREGEGYQNGEETQREGESHAHRTVLHTYSVFISSVSADERERIPHPSDHTINTGASCQSDSSLSLANREHTSKWSNGVTLADARERHPEDKSVEDEFKRKISLRGRIRQGVKTSLEDLKLFLCSKGSSLSLFIYCIFSFGVIGMDEVYSLWAFTSAHHGGLGFTLYQIGISLSVAGALMLPTSLILYPLLERYLGLINSYYVSVCVVIGIAVLLPNLHYLVPFGLSWLLWISLCTMKFIFMVFVSAAFASTILFINNSVTFDKLGAINGLAVSMTAITRTIAPIFAGSVFAGSLSPSALALGFPFNYNLIFVICGAVFLSTIVMATCLPSTVNKQKVIEDTENYVDERSEVSSLDSTQANITEESRT